MAGEGLFRVLLAVILFSNLAVSAFFRGRARRRTGVIPRRAESSRLIATRLLVGVPGLVAIGAYLIDPALMSWSRLDLPAWTRWLGVALGFAALPLVAWTLASLGSNVSETTLTKSNHELVTHGPYRWVRHPLYSSAGLVLLPGIALITASWFVAALALVGMSVVRWRIIPPEERALEAHFGERYRKYRAHTGALWPRLRPARARS